MSNCGGVLVSSCAAWTLCALAHSCSQVSFIVSGWPSEDPKSFVTELQECQVDCFVVRGDIGA